MYGLLTLGTVPRHSRVMPMCAKKLQLLKPGALIFCNSSVINLIDTWKGLIRPPLAKVIVFFSRITIGTENGLIDDCSN